MAQATIILIVATLALVTYLSLFRRKQKLPKGSRLPPGPPGKPLVGNLLDIPAKHSWLQFKKWSDQYGPVMSLSLAGSQHVVLSTEKMANDLLRERGSHYSSRVQAPASAELLSDNLRPVLLPNNGIFDSFIQRQLNNC